MMLISVFGYGQAYEGTVQHDAKSQPPRQSTKASNEGDAIENKRTGIEKKIADNKMISSSN